MTHLSKLELRALEVLVDHYNSEGNCLYFRTIADLAGIKAKQIRRIVRSLARKQCAELVRGLFDDEGMTAGSGYCATPVGKKLMERHRLRAALEELRAGFADKGDLDGELMAEAALTNEQKP